MLPDQASVHASVVSEIAHLVTQVARMTLAPDLGAQTEIYPEGDQGPLVFVNVRGDTGP